MDNESGHKGKVLILKVKTGSTLISNGEAKACDSPMSALDGHSHSPTRLPLESLSHRRLSVITPSEAQIKKGVASVLTQMG